MSKSRNTWCVAIAAGLIAATVPTAATAQDEPATPNVRDELRTGTRIQTITVIGAIRDQRAPKRAEQPADRSVPELPVTYEGGEAKPGR